MIIRIIAITSIFFSALLILITFVVTTKIVIRIVITVIIVITFCQNFRTIKGREQVDSLTGASVAVGGLGCSVRIPKARSQSTTSMPAPRRRLKQSSSTSQLGLRRFRSYGRWFRV